jgi:hypothetical protein
MTERATPDEYLDFLGRSMPLVDVQATLRVGNFPPGLILADEAGRQGIITGQPGKPQKIKRLKAWIG